MRVDNTAVGVWLQLERCHVMSMVASVVNASRYRPPLKGRVRTFGDDYDDVDDAMLLWRGIRKRDDDLLMASTLLCPYMTC